MADRSVDFLACVHYGAESLTIFGYVGLIDVIRIRLGARYRVHRLEKACGWGQDMMLILAACVSLFRIRHSFQFSGHQCLARI